MQTGAEGPSRALGLLALAWIIAYWWWQPGPDGGLVNSAIEQRPARSVATPPQVRLDPLPLAEPPPAPESQPTQAATPTPDLAEADPLPAAPEEQAPQPTPPEDRALEQAAPERFHVVRRGDTLSEIALREYGSIRFARLIFEANRDQLASMDDLQIGMELRLPPPPG